MTVGQPIEIGNLDVVLEVRYGASPARSREDQQRWHRLAEGAREKRRQRHVGCVRRMDDE